jgi:hypothetical protein
VVIVKARDGSASLGWSRSGGGSETGSRKQSGPQREGDGGMQSIFEAGEGWAWRDIGVRRWSR